MTFTNLFPARGSCVCFIWEPNYCNDSSYHRGTQACLSSTGASVCSQHFIRLHITTENRPPQIPEILPSCQQPNFYVCLSLCARASGLQRTGNDLSLHSHQSCDALLLDGETFPSLTLLKISFRFFVTRPSLCLQFLVCGSSNPSGIKLMDCDKAQFQIIALTRVVW